MIKGLKKLPKRLGLGIFYVMALILALLLVMHTNPLADPHTEMLKKICGCILIGISCILVFFWYDRLLVLPVELFHSRKLIKRLSVNDFKKRYAGSYMGIVWALAQPVITVIMYYIIFDVVFQSRAEAVSDGIEVPYVLMLTAGLVPWFFFSEALTNGTTSLLEYNYLVKKVLFKISILPIIKIIAAMFIHVFFICVLLLIACVYGYYPSVYWIQILYYMACEFILVLSLSYATSAIVVFFRDLLQIINIGLQLFQWFTPILWNINIVPDRFKWIFKLNPMAYIVEGYRNAIYGDTWFFEHFYSSTYFWIFVVATFCIGTLIFKRSKPHFADVL
ncbi:teichoic acid transport system permease protein [Butyrivibrio hungatei DSM 14810]|uniref:Transport permease protein n=1 Tax=Butyrivibrio hungatei DSM 14810 TaxID=1121132 RepID=A0A1M7T003_9FIRM|nr:ABC transporter permease [Butyrivibrio hungatei]SHN64065.1 teichoic acid transport system permease protein [Butyrivibrio hungatei DSM 14810]